MPLRLLLQVLLWPVVLFLCLNHEPPLLFLCLHHELHVVLFCCLHYQLHVVLFCCLHHEPVVPEPVVYHRGALLRMSEVVHYLYIQNLTVECVCVVFVQGT